MKRPLPFLPTFFIVLGLVFAAAVVARLRSYTAAPPVAVERPAVVETETALPVNSGTHAPEAAPSVSETVAAPASENASRSAAAAERERRYRELLNTPAAGSREAGAAAPQPPPKESKSLISRIVSPIVTAFGGDKPKKEAPAARREARETASVNQKSGSSGDSSSSGDRAKETVEPKDPNSDTTPPQLQSITFDPQVVEDGQEVVLTVYAVDDLSGVRAISGNIASPGGTLQGFALDRQGEGRYVARIMIPKNSAEGMWHVNFLNMTDLASNARTLSWRQGLLPSTASFKVTSSKPDTKGPAIRGVYFERPVMAKGDKNALVVEVEDLESGVNVVTGVLVSPNKFARIPMGCQNDGSLWRCDIAVPANADCGEWTLEQVQAQDKANNLTILRSEHPTVANKSVNITSDGCDSVPPVVRGVSVDNANPSAPGTVQVIVQASDDASGVQSVAGYFVFTGSVAPGSQPPRLYFSARPGEDAQTWSGALTLQENVARGIWKLSSVQVADKAGNSKSYTVNEPVVAAVTIRVQ